MIDELDPKASRAIEVGTYAFVIFCVCEPDWSQTSCASSLTACLSNRNLMAKQTPELSQPSVAAHLLRTSLLRSHPPVWFLLKPAPCHKTWERQKNARTEHFPFYFVE